jgi:hypothetical protein
MPRRRILRLVLIAVGTILATSAVGGLALYYAASAEPPFYQQAMAIDSQTLERGSDRMLEKATSLANAMRKKKPWETLFTAEQINGWLAVDLVKNHPKALPSNMHDPRVIVDTKQITFACRFEQNGIESVLSLTIEPYVPEPNVLALRIVKARAGLLPVPLGKVLERFSKAAREMRFHLEWRRAGNDPVALLSFPADDDRPICIETLRLGDGEIYVSGKTPPKSRKEL